MGAMKVVCGWCGNLMGYGTVESDKVSHAMCRDCFVRYCPSIPISPEMESEWKRYADSLKGERHGQGSV